MVKKGYMGNPKYKYFKTKKEMDDWIYENEVKFDIPGYITKNSPEGKSMKKYNYRVHYFLK